MGYYGYMFMISSKNVIQGYGRESNWMAESAFWKQKKKKHGLPVMQTCATDNERHLWHLSVLLTHLQLI